jgi:hypothetical protein
VNEEFGGWMAILERSDRLRSGSVHAHQVREGSLRAGDGDLIDDDADLCAVAVLVDFDRRLPRENEVSCLRNRELGPFVSRENGTRPPSREDGRNARATSSR